MNLADLGILAIVVVSALISVRRGFTREAFSLATWVTAFIIARLFGPSLEVLLERFIDTPSVRMAVAFGSLFAATLIVGALLNHLLGELVRVTGLAGTDRMFGMIFGMVRGLVLVLVLVVIGKPMFEDDSWWNESLLVPHFAMMEDWSRQVAAEFMAFVLSFEPESVE